MQMILEQMRTCRTLPDLILGDGPHRDWYLVSSDPLATFPEGADSQPLENESVVTVMAKVRVRVAEKRLASRSQNARVAEAVMRHAEAHWPQTA